MNNSGYLNRVEVGGDWAAGVVKLPRQTVSNEAISPPRVYHAAISCLGVIRT